MATLNTAIRGVQLATAIAADGLQKDASENLAIDVSDFIDTTAGLEDDGSENIQVNLGTDAGLDFNAGAIEVDVTDIIDTAAGLTESGGDIQVDLKANGGLTFDTGETQVDIDDMTEAAINVANDYIAFGDADDTTTKKEKFEDVVTAIAGTGLTATSGVLSVDAISDNIVESDILYENESSNCNGSNTTFTLAETPITNSVQVYLNGLLQEEGSGKDYLLSGTTVEFAVAPAAGDILLVHYIQDN